MTDRPEDLPAMMDAFLRMARAAFGPLADKVEVLIHLHDASDSTVALLQRAGARCSTHDRSDGERFECFQITEGASGLSAFRTLPAAEDAA